MKSLLVRQRQFLLYCVIGASGVSLDYGIYALLLKTGRLDCQAANAVSYASGTLLSFILNARFNFRRTDKLPWRLACFFGVASLGWLVSAGLLRILIEGYGFNKYYAKIPTLVVVVLLQYNLNRVLSFRKTG